jgi:gamma-glutamylcysteine synthetase
LLFVEIGRDVAQIKMVQSYNIFIALGEKQEMKKEVVDCVRGDGW